MACSDAALMPATCGVSTTCSSRRSGPSGRGSTSNTSSPAPPSRPASMRRHQRRLVDQAAAGGVDQDGAGLHQPEPAGVHQMAGLGRQWRVQRDEIGLAQQLVEIDQTVAEPGHGVGLGDRVGDQDLHVEAKTALGDGAADAAEPDHAHRGLVQPAVQQWPPAAAAHAPVVLRDPVGRSRHQRQGMVGDRVVVGPEGHGDGNPVPSSRGHVDVLVAHAQSGDDLEVGRRGEHPLIVGLQAGDGRHHAVQPLDQLGLGEPAPELVPPDLDTRLRSGRTGGRAARKGSPWRRARLPGARVPRIAARAPRRRRCRARGPRGTRPRGPIPDARRMPPRWRRPRRRPTIPDRPWVPPARNGDSRARPPACCGHGAAPGPARPRGARGSKRNSAMIVTGSRLTRGVGGMSEPRSDLRIDAPVHLSRPSPPCKRCARHKARSDQAVASGPSGARRSTLACDPSTCPSLSPDAELTLSE